MRTNTTMKLTALAAAMGLVMSSGAWAEMGSDDMTVDWDIDPIDLITVTGTPSLAITTTTDGNGGSLLLEDSDNSGKWNVTTNGSDRKITAKLDTAMPEGVTLELVLDAGTVGTPGSEVTLNASAQEVYSGLTKTVEANKGMTYTLNATVAAGVLNEQSRTVTFTLTGS